MPAKRRTFPYFTAAAYACAIGAVPVTGRFAEWLAPREDLLGYGGLAAALTLLMALFGAGLILSLAGLWRRERPRALTVLAALFNALGVLWILLDWS